MDAARLIKSRNPHSVVEVKDLKSGDVTAAALRRVRDDPQAPPDGPWLRGVGRIYQTRGGSDSLRWFCR
jgi:hypothetical protein